MLPLGPLMVERRRRRVTVTLGICALVAGVLAETVGARVSYVTKAGSTHPVIWVARNDGSSPRRIVHGGSPRIVFAASLSPNGRLVVYDQGSLSPDVQPPRLMLVRAAGGRPRMLASSASILAWAPDSRRLATVITPSTGKQRLVMIEVATGKMRTVAMAGGFSGVSFSPDSDRLAYAAGPVAPERAFQVTRDVYTVSVTGGRSTRLTDDHHSEEPVWGPDLIVFSRWRDVKQSHGRTRRIENLYLVSPTGRHRHQLTDADGYSLTAIGWSSDGRRLLANISANAYYAVTVDPSSGALERVGEPSPSHGPTGIVGLALSRDGTAILGALKRSVTDVGSTIVTIPYEGGTPRVLARAANDASWNR